VKQNYEIHDKEMLAIIRALEEWRHFLEGATHPVEIWTDHKNLKYFMTAKKLNRCQARWSLYLVRFNFLLHHRPGRTMGKPDALSRRANHGNGASNNENIVLLRPEFLAVCALKGIELTGVEQKILSDIHKGNRNGDQEEPIAKAARELRSSANEAVHSSEWSNVDGLLRFRGKIYVPWSLDLRRQIVALCHDTQIAGHPGHWKTLELVSQNYWWPQMSRYIGQYVSTCDLCLQTKPWRHSPVSELQLLSVPDAWWDTLSVDFVVKLPESSGHDAVMTVVDAVSKRVHFIPTHTMVIAEGAARLFLHYVWKLHGLLKRVVSDRRPQFVALFTKELYRLLGIRISSSTAWHPQTDGQMEHVNQELDQFLYLFVNKWQDNWYDLLPIAEFQHNNYVYSAMQQPPFPLDTGRIPRMGFEPRQDPSSLEIVNEFTKRMESTTEEAKSTIRKAQEDMTRYYNRRRSLAFVFQPGDRVYLDASDIKTTRSSLKLSHCRLEPFKIERQVGPLAYRLKLPHRLRQLHPVFNVVKLSAAPDNLIPGRKPQAPPSPIVVDRELEWEVEEVLDSRWHQRRFQFLIK